eukprot:4996874-Amphidinium_carterae.1
MASLRSRHFNPTQGGSDQAWRDTRIHKLLENKHEASLGDPKILERCEHPMIRKKCVKGAFQQQVVCVWTGRQKDLSEDSRDNTKSQRDKENTRTSKKNAKLKREFQTCGLLQVEPRTPTLEPRTPKPLTLVR